jgi:hypothetical protein
LEYAVSSSGGLRESHKVASLAAAAFTASVRSGTLRKASLSPLLEEQSRRFILANTPTEIQERNLKMKLPEPNSHEVDPAITTSRDENASREVKSHPLPLSNLTFFLT